MTTDAGSRSAALDIVEVGDRQVVMTRAFAAPPALVFDALVMPSLLLKWMHGPAGWRMVECDFDATVGGRYRYVWRGPNGQLMTAKGVVRQVIRPKRLVTVEPSGDDRIQGHVTVVSEVTADRGGTLLTITATYPSPSARNTALGSGMVRGMDASFAQLDHLLTDHNQGSQG